MVIFWRLIMINHDFQIPIERGFLMEQALCTYWHHSIELIQSSEWYICFTCFMVALRAVHASSL